MEASGLLCDRSRAPSMAAHRGLPRPALALRIAHACIAIAMLDAIAYVWWCALTARRGPLLRVAVTALLGEGAVVVANHGRCPLGPLQERLGDPVPLFELVLSPRAAHRAVPLLGGMAAVPMVVLARRRFAGVPPVTAS
jgi:hypothetical protein